MVFTSYMDAALEQARAAGDRGEVPVGAVIVWDGAVIAAAGNRTRELKDPTAHAEILAIRDGAYKAGNYRLTGLTLYVTLEPCTMCAGAISNARLGRVVFGAYDPKGGAVEHGVQFFSSSNCHHRPDVTGGVLAEDCGQLLKSFFKARRK